MQCMCEVQLNSPWVCSTAHPNALHSAPPSPFPFQTEPTQTDQTGDQFFSFSGAPLQPSANGAWRVLAGQGRSQGLIRISSTRWMPPVPVKRPLLGVRRSQTGPNFSFHHPLAKNTDIPRYDSTVRVVRDPRREAVRRFREPHRVRNTPVSPPRGPFRRSSARGGRRESGGGRGAAPLFPREQSTVTEADRHTLQLNLLA